MKMDSLGDFHSSHAASYPLLQAGFQGNRTRTLAGVFGASAPLSTVPTQGRLLCTQRYGSKGRVAPQCRFISGIVQRSDTAKGVRRCTISSLHSDRVIFSMPLEIARPPQAQSPSHSIHPRLGVRSRHHGVHRYAKQRIFRPFLATGKAD